VSSTTNIVFRGDYRNCDIPLWTAEAMLTYAAQVEQVSGERPRACSSLSLLVQADFIYYTGDLPAHNVWNQSRSDQLHSINTINDMLARLFPNKTFYSAVGNHEAGRVTLDDGTVSIRCCDCRTSSVQSVSDAKHPHGQHHLAVRQFSRQLAETRLANRHARHHPTRRILHECRSAWPSSDITQYELLHIRQLLADHQFD
jgi:hypothetical protein